ncbi:hypothetical protein F2Q69_00062128, partial [Brassica cretica]
TKGSCLSSTVLPYDKAGCSDIGCVAKRWRDLIAFVSDLTLDDSEFLHHEKGKQDRPEIVQSFMDFVDRVLALKSSFRINKFSLKCSSTVDTDRVDGWISSVLARNVSILEVEVDLDEDGLENYQLPPKRFESKTLVELNVGCGV